MVLSPEVVTSFVVTWLVETAFVATREVATSLAQTLLVATPASPGQLSLFKVAARELTGVAYKVSIAEVNAMPFEVLYVTPLFVIVLVFEVLSCYPQFWTLPELSATSFVVEA